MKINLCHILLGMLLLILAACNDMRDVEHEYNLPEGPYTGKMLVLSEGLIYFNNSKLAFYDFTTQELIPDYFRVKNKRGLGDTANDMLLYGSKVYIAVSESSRVEVLDINSGLSLAQIPLFDENHRSRRPRNIACNEGKVYVTCFDGTLARIDTVSLTVEAMVKCGRNPEGLCIVADKIYVANSGGLDFPDYDNTISVIDLKTFIEIKKIEVYPNPYKIYSDSQDDVYVCMHGDNNSESYHFLRIDTYADEVVQDFEGLNVLNFIIYEDKAYMYSFDFNTDENWIKVFDCLSEKVINENFVTDNTVIAKPFSIGVNPYDGNLYITNVPQFTSSGDVMCFSPEGKLQFRIDNIGINPNSIIFFK